MRLVSWLLRLTFDLQSKNELSLSSRLFYKFLSQITVTEKLKVHLDSYVAKRTPNKIPGYG